MTTKTLSLISAFLLLVSSGYAEETLEPIFVTTSNKTKQSIEKTTASIIVITAEDIDEKGYQTVAEAINTVSGISVANSGGIGQQTSFFLRGADSGKVLVLLDGMRLNDPSTTNGTALLDSLSTSNVQQIEIVKGGSGSIWGSNASAGVINIISKEAKDGVHGSLGFNYGSYQTKGAEASLSYKDDKLSAQVLTSYLKSESFSALLPRDAEADAYENKSLNLKLAYTFDQNNQLRLYYNTIQTHTEFDDSFSMEQAEDDYSYGTSDQSNIALDYLYQFENYSSTFHASKGEYDRDYYTQGFFGGHNVYQTTLEEYSLINAYAYTLGKLVLGLEYKDIDGFNQFENFSQSQANYINKAVYLSNIYDINEDTLLETNLRYDNYSEFANKTTYKLGIKHQHRFLQGFSTAANYYTSYDAPSAYQLANTALSAVLKPSYIKGYDISFAYKELLSLTYFNNTVEDSIEYVASSVPFEGGYENIDGTSKFSGLELEGSYTLSNYNLIFTANYTHLFEFEKEDGSDFVRRPKDTLNASAGYYTHSDMYFGIDAQYIGDRIDTDGGFPVSSEVSTGNYTLWNLNFSTQLIQDIDLSIHAKNIFDKDYESVYGYATEGRSFYAKIKYSF
ncbi:MAG: hypothetical protein DRQ78_04010 [Epsilonproteobacteria bacterium]|nr:MAG: hypothetical protein DRQ78_04010 [Campylobacterota bacterium]